MTEANELPFLPGFRLLRDPNVPALWFVKDVENDIVAGAIDEDHARALASAVRPDPSGADLAAEVERLRADLDRVRAWSERRALDIVTLGRMWGQEKVRAEAAERALGAARADALEEAASLLEQEVNDVELDAFFCNGVRCTNDQGHTRFVSTPRLTSMLHRRAASIRALAGPDAGGRDAG